MFLIAPLLVCATAAAGTPTTLDMTLGAELSVNDPTQQDLGLRLGAAVTPSPWFSVEAMGAWYPNLRGGLAIYEYAEMPDLDTIDDLSPIHSRLQLDVGVWPLEASWEVTEVVAGLVAGGTLVYTVDDNGRAPFSPDDPYYAATKRQWHPSPLVGVVTRLDHGHFVADLRLEGLRYVEQVGSTDLSPRNLLMAGLSAGWRL